MKSSVSPCARRISATRSSTCACTETSRALVASSITSRSGSIASARAIATRWRCPPESVLGRATACSSPRPTAASSSMALAPAAARSSPACSCSTSLTAWRAGIRGSRDRYGSWNTICTLFARASRSSRRFGTALVSRPPIRMVPVSVCSRPTIMRASVDFPDPDSPTTARAPPAGISRSAPTTARTSPRPRTRYVFETPATCTMGSSPAAPEPTAPSSPLSRGVAATSRLVYSACGARSTSRAGPSSTTAPSFITTSRSHRDPARFRSCVMNSMPIPRSAQSSRSTCTISACVVTSSAVVGSSQTSSRGAVVRAPAIMTRCSMPPLSSCGCWSRCSAGEGRRTSASSSAARARARARGHLSFRRRASVRWSPIVRIGLMPARGSWNTIAASERRTARSAAGESGERPSTETLPPMCARSGVRPSTVRAVRDLPDPDSPTRPTVSPGATDSVIPCRRRVPSERSRVRSRISSSADGSPSADGLRRADVTVMRGSPLRCGRRGPRRRC
ncbi:hypothetical protein RL72_00078 [Microbacterium azadirachtae]|uniref:Uncharacterized protein n=1 Tax=Microbacterium azadirachtae TaxID=582680 RepID=A0A0F0LLD2_9MICO|nr:hypothetical protein RL72_00078 [Microbacterium azadirachtae]